MRELMQDNFNKEILESKGVHLVDFFATWCGPCKMLSPVLEGLSEKVSDDIHIWRLDIDQNRSLALEYDVTAVPTMIIFKDGVLVERLVGFNPEGIIKEKLEYYAKSL